MLIMFLHDFSKFSCYPTSEAEVKLLSFIKSGEFTGDDVFLEIGRSRT